VGRWNVIDPLVKLYQESTSPYIYVLNNPVKLTDHDGRFPNPYQTMQFWRGVGRGIASGFNGTVNFLTEEAWKLETWKGTGNLTLGLMLMQGQPANLACLADIDRKYGTKTMSAVMAFYGQISSGADKFVNGDAGQRGEIVGQVLYGIAESVVASKGAGIVTNAMKGTELAANVMKGSSAVNVAAKGGFSSMMEAGEAARYAKYWENYAPKQVAPGTTRMDWLRVSGRTGRMESSRVIYDSYGRQTYRIDFSNHMRPLDHSVPHLHQYGPMSTFGKESVFNFFGQ
jgi:hypothetical protein